MIKYSRFSPRVTLLVVAFVQVFALSGCWGDGGSSTPPPKTTPPTTISVPSTPTPPPPASVPSSSGTGSSTGSTGSGSSGGSSGGGTPSTGSGGSTGGGSSGGSTGACIPPTYGSTSGPLAITTKTCPPATQGSPYAGCSVVATGGVPPYTFSTNTSTSYPTLPEGMVMAACNGSISASIVGGQGYYAPQIIVTDAAGNTATQQIQFEVAGNNAFLQKVFPSNSIFHTNISALPVDTSPAAPIPLVYQSAHIRVFFGNTNGAPFPSGIPAIEVPATQSDVSVATTLYQSYFTSAPIPPYAPIESTANSTGADRHVLVYQEASASTPPALYEMWQGAYVGASGWIDSSNALWPDTSSNALTPQGKGTSDAAGLPVAPLLVTADEVIGTGTPSAPNGVVKHPIRFTLNHMLNYWVWPATETSGVGYCQNSSGQSISVGQELSQSTPPSYCNTSAPAGEIYRLKASVADPSCAASSPQAAIIITAMRNYGIILADNGLTGGLIGTPDSRWNDADLACLSQLTLSDFEPVNVSSLMVSDSSGAIQ